MVNLHTYVIILLIEIAQIFFKGQYMYITYYIFPQIKIDV